MPIQKIIFSGLPCLWGWLLTCEQNLLSELGENSLRALELAGDLLLFSFPLSSYLQCSHDYGCTINHLVCI